MIFFALGHRGDKFHPELRSYAMVDAHGYYGEYGNNIDLKNLEENLIAIVIEINSNNINSIHKN